MQQKPEFSIIFPVMNQSDHIERVIRSYHETLTKNSLSFEMIAVINGTSDNSFEICKRIEGKLSNFYAYELKGKGFGLGILHGIKKSQGEYLVYLNCARINAEDLFMSLKYFLVNPEYLVHGVRVTRDIPQRTFFSLIYSTLCRLIFSLKTWDVNGNPNVFSRKLFDRLQLKFTDSMIDVELQDKAQKFDLTVLEVPIHSYRRHGGISTTTFWTSFRLMKEVVRYWLTTRFKPLTHLN